MKPLQDLSTLALALAFFAAPVAAQVPQQINYQGRVTVGGVNFTGSGQFKFALVDGGVNLNQTATANATTTGGGVQIFLLTMGNGYTSAPAVTITNGAGSSGSGATAMAALGGGPGSGTGPTDSVGTITITNPGSGYTSAIVTIAPPPPNIVNTTYWSNDGTSNGGSAPASAVPLGVTSGLYSLALGDLALANMDAALPASAFDNPDVRLRVWFDDSTHGSQLLSPDQRFATVPYAFRAALAQNVPAGAINSAQLADGAVTSAKLGSGAVGTAQIASGALTPTQLFTSSGPQSGQVLSFDGTKFNWITASGGGGGSLTLPYSGIASGSFGSSIFHVSSTTPILGTGIEGESLHGAGIFGHSPNSVGVLGQSDGYYGVQGETTAVNSSGVYGYSSANGSAGVKGASNGNGPAIDAFSIGSGVGISVSSLGNDGIDATTSVATKSAVYAHTSTANAYGVYAISNQYTALAAQTQNAGQTAGFFWNSAGGDAIRTTGNVKVTGDTNVTGDCVVNGILGTNTFLSVNGAAQINGNVTVNATTTTRVLTITGGMDVAEPFVMGEGAELPKGSVVVIDTEHPGKLARSSQPYDKRVAGIVSGANGIHPGIALRQDGLVEGGQNVALNGRVYVLADATDGPIHPGDLLTTSATPGHAMKVSDPERAQGAVLGKAMSALDKGTGYVLVLVTLQ